MSSAPSPASYPGNPSLPVEVREKILATFRHALNLFSSGNVSDCLIGCEFILKMDPRFTPAQRLREKARNPDSDMDISELQALANPPTPGSPAPAPPPPPAAQPRPEKPEPGRLLAEAERKYETRDFEGAITAATRVLALAPGNTDALAMIQKAAGKKAMEPLIEASRVHAERALGEGRIPDARLEVERLRAADPEHPSLPSLERRLAAASAPAASAAPDSGLGPPASDEFVLGGPQSEGYGSTPAFGDLSSEPAGLDPIPSPPSGFVGSEETPPELDALVPPSHPSPDLFLPADEAPSIEMRPLSSPQTDEEDARAGEREIDTLLKQGDEMAKKGDRQQAIEIWSRVFLIDINNSEAVTRIEKTRQEMTEETRMVAECLKKGRESYEAGDSEAARKFFLQAQALDPDEPTARLYLERIEKGEAETAVAETAGKPAAPAGTDQSREPAPALAAVSTAPKRPRAALPVNPKVLAVVGALLAMTLVGVYFVFKGTRTQAPPPSVVSSGSLQRARELLGKGEVEQARIELRRIGAADPDSEEARKLLADLSRGDAADAGKAARPASSEARGDNDPARLRAIAEEALSQKRYIDALKNFNLAAPAFRGDPNFAKEQSLASEKVAALTPAVKVYNEGEYETAIPILWRIVQEDRDNQDARSYLLRSYYNQGITQLQNGLYQKAVQAFQETLALDPNDSEAARHKKFAERYQKGDLDLMGRIYVRHLSRRQ
jgi:tetratricopeptide (TPR) repeat protein